MYHHPSFYAGLFFLCVILFTVGLLLRGCYVCIIALGIPNGWNALLISSSSFPTFASASVQGDGVCENVYDTFTKIIIHKFWAFVLKEYFYLEDGWKQPNYCCSFCGA